MPYLFPLLAKRLDKNPDESLMKMLNSALSNTDNRVAQGKPITPAYLLAFMLWPDVEERAKAAIKNGAPIADSILKASDSVISEQLKVISIPKRFSGPMREIWQLQPRLEQWRGGRALKIMENRRFRAAYDFLCLRASIEPKLKPMAKWWTDVQEVAERDRLDFMSKKPIIDGIWGNKVTSATGKKRRRYNNKNRRRKVSKDN